MDVLQKIEAIAIETRKFLEELQENEGVWLDGLCGACGIGAYINWVRIKQQHPELSPTFRMGSGEVFHCWTQIKVNKERYVIDVTATQFASCKPVIVEPLRKYARRSFAEMFYDEVYPHDKALRKYTEWTGDESITHFRKEIAQRFPTVTLTEMIGYDLAV